MINDQLLRGGELNLPKQDAEGRPSPAAKFHVAFVLDEFPITAEFSGNGAQLRQMTERLRALGALPPSDAPPKTVASTTAPAQPEESVPQYRYHGAMKKAPWGKYRCTARLPDGSFCKERAA